MRGVGFRGGAGSAMEAFGVVVDGDDLGPPLRNVAGAGSGRSRWGSVAFYRGFGGLRRNQPLPRVGPTSPARGDQANGVLLVARPVRPCGSDWTGSSEAAPDDLVFRLRFLGAQYLDDIQSTSLRFIWESVSTRIFPMDLTGHLRQILIETRKANQRADVMSCRGHC